MYVQSRERMMGQCTEIHALLNPALVLPNFFMT